MTDEQRYRPEDQRHVEARSLLLTGQVPAFNELRKRNPDVPIVLNDENLHGLSLVGIDLHGALFTRVRLSGADLTGANFEGATLLGCIAQGSKLAKACFGGAKIGVYEQPLIRDGRPVRWKSVFDHADLSEADLRGAHLSEAELFGAVLTKADLRGAILECVSVRGAILQHADARGAVIKGLPSQLAAFQEVPLGANDGPAPFVQGLNAFGARLFNKKTQSDTTPPNWRVGIVLNGPTEGDDPSVGQNTNHVNAEEKKENAMAPTQDQGMMGGLRERAGKLLEQIDPGIRAEIEEGIRLGVTEMFIDLAAPAIVDLFDELLALGPEGRQRLDAFVKAPLGKTLLTGLLAGCVTFMPVPDGAAKTTRDLLAHGLRVKMIAAGTSGVGQKIIGVFGPIFEKATLFMSEGLALATGAMSQQQLYGSTQRQTHGAQQGHEPVVVAEHQRGG